MIHTDEEALMCDLAETYGIFNYRSLPARLVATFSVGLRDDSRIKMKMNGVKASNDTLLLAHMLDRLNQFMGCSTESVAEQFYDIEPDETQTASMTIEEYEEARKKF